MRRLAIVLFAIFSLSTQAQEKKEAPKFGINFTGFVKSDFFHDTRQAVNIREGHFLLYPENISKDANGKDINASPSFNMLSIQSRLKGTITGPDAFKAKTMGVVEADFFGNENAAFVDANGFRLRHAFVKLSWSKSELIAGQYWHPFFVPEAFPSVISFNSGVPYQPFSRNPQLRFTYKMKQVKAIAAAFMQRDFQGTGPDGANTKYIRNAGFPNLSFQLQFNPDSAAHQFNVGIGYKAVKPELFTLNTTTQARYATNTTLSSVSYFGSALFSFKPVKLKFYGVYAANATDMTMLGGYAVAKVTNANTGAKEFTNLNTLALWTEIQTTAKKFNVGLFAGYSKNLGSKDNITGAIYARNANIDYSYRIAPRMVFTSGKLDIAFELESTLAAYGTQNGDNKGGVTDTTSVTNLRSLLAFIYNF